MILSTSFYILLSIKDGHRTINRAPDTKWMMASVVKPLPVSRAPTQISLLLVFTQAIGLVAFYIFAHNKISLLATVAAINYTDYL